MHNVGYVNPFVPPEWIAAHRLRPVWLTLEHQPGELPEGAHRGLCPYAGALIVEAFQGTAADSLVLTTVCDQMRYAAAYLDAHCRAPTFLLNVPSTWQDSSSRGLYREELARLGDFLLEQGGRKPAAEHLAATIERYETQRAAARKVRPFLSAGQWARTLAALRGDLAPLEERPASAITGDGLTNEPPSNDVPPGPSLTETGIPLAMVGGPLLAGDERFLELVARAGGNVVLDASEGGERTLPAPADRRRLAADPLEELVRMYFDTIPDVFRRPNTHLHDWLAEQMAARGVRGILFRRYLFCDLWNAELHRLRKQSGLPVLAIDLVGDEDGEAARALGQIEAFLETLHADRFR